MVVLTQIAFVLSNNTNDKKASKLLAFFMGGSGESIGLGGKMAEKNGGNGFDAFF